MARRLGRDLRSSRSGSVGTPGCGARQTLSYAYAAPNGQPLRAGTAPVVQAPIV